MTDTDKLYLKRLREGAGLTQKELAETLGYSVSLISAWDNGKSFPDLTCWKRLCDLYHVRLRDFLHERESPSSNYHTYSIDLENLAQRLESCRKQKGWTLAQLSSRLGINIKTLSSWERGTSFPSRESFLNFCSLYGLSPEKLFYGDDLEPPVSLPSPSKPRYRSHAPILAMASLLLFGITLSLPINPRPISIVEPSTVSSSYPFVQESEMESAAKPFESVDFEPYLQEEVAGKALVLCVDANGTELFRRNVAYGSYPSDIDFYPSPYVGKEKDELYVFAGWEEKGRLLSNTVLHAKYHKISAKAYYSSGYDFIFNDDEDTLYLHTYKGDMDAQEIRIPSSIDGYPVTAVGPILLNQTNAVERLVFPDSVTSIRGLMLSGSSSLREVLLPSSLSEVPWGLVSQCENLRFNTYEGGLYLGSEDNPYLLFAGATSNSVKLAQTCAIFSPVMDEPKADALSFPSSITYMGRNGLSWLMHAQSVEVAEDNPRFAFRDGCLVDESKRELLYVSDKAQCIPEGIRVIKSGSLLQYSQSQLMFPNSVEEVESGALSGSNPIQETTLGAKLSFFAVDNWHGLMQLGKIRVDEDNPSYTVLNGMLFSKDLGNLLACPPTLGVVTLTLPSQTRAIFPGCFHLQYHLEEIHLCSSEYDNFELLGELAFEGCERLQKVYASSSMKVIPANAFYRCYAIRELHLRPGLTQIENYAFSPATSLTDIYFAGTQEEWESIEIGENAFEDGHPVIHVLGQSKE